MCEEKEKDKVKDPRVAEVVQETDVLDIDTASVVSEVTMCPGGVLQASAIARLLCLDELLPFGAAAASSKVDQVSRYPVLVRSVWIFVEMESWRCGSCGKGRSRVLVVRGGRTSPAEAQERRIWRYR